MEQLVQIVCGWCGVGMGAKMAEVPEGFKPITHDICGPCKEKFLKEAEEGR